LQQWRSRIAAKKRRQRRCMSEAQRPERQKTCLRDKNIIRNGTKELIG